MESTTILATEVMLPGTSLWNCDPAFGASVGPSVGIPLTDGGAYYPEILVSPQDDDEEEDWDEEDEDWDEEDEDWDDEDSDEEDEDYDEDEDDDEEDEDWDEEDKDDLEEEDE